MAGAIFGFVLEGVDDDGFSTIYWTFVMAQVIGGFVAYVWAARRALRVRREWQTPTIEVVSDPLQGSRA